MKERKRTRGESRAINILEEEKESEKWKGIGGRKQRICEWTLNDRMIERMNSRNRCEKGTRDGNEGGGTKEL